MMKKSLKWFRYLTASRLSVFSLMAWMAVGLVTATPAASESSSDCILCHGTFETVHTEPDHTAAPGSGLVTIFRDNQHDPDGRNGVPPYFAVNVNCSLCHTLDLPAAHGNDCATCHPSNAYDTLGEWNKGCQQGGCHVSMHQEYYSDHNPWASYNTDSGNDCSLCHGYNFDVTSDKCLNCHERFNANDTSPPVTVVSGLSEYVGLAAFRFSIKENGKAGVGRTFYQFNQGPVQAAAKNLWVNQNMVQIGQNELKFWSVDQAGNVEATPQYTFFNMIKDTEKPTSNSNALSNYEQGATITLIATDNNTYGAKGIYYQINNGPTQFGGRVTNVSIPATPGTIDYELKFWAIDHVGNVEDGYNYANFTVTSGTGTIRLIFDNAADGDWATWKVTRGSYSGPVYASGSAGGPGWSGVNDIVVPISPEPYFVHTEWYWDEEDWLDESNWSNLDISTHGTFIELHY